MWDSGRLASLVARAVTRPLPMVLSGGMASSACIATIRVVIGAVIVDLMALLRVFCMSSTSAFCCVHQIPIPYVRIGSMVAFRLVSAAEGGGSLISQ